MTEEQRGSTEQRGSAEQALAAMLRTAPTGAEQLDRRFRIEGDTAEAMKVVLAQLPADDK